LAVRCRAGAHVASRDIAFRGAALRSNACPGAESDCTIVSRTICRAVDDLERLTAL